MAMTLQNVKRVGIIGAGVAGLATAKTLLAEGLDCTVFERGERLGGVWADGYSNFGVQVQKELYQFPDWPLPDDAPNFTPGPVFQKYLEDYADHFGIRPHLRFGARVTDLEPRDDAAPGWTMTVEEDGKKTVEDFDLVDLPGAGVCPDVKSRIVAVLPIVNMAEVIDRARHGPDRPPLRLQHSSKTREICGGEVE